MNDYSIPVYPPKTECVGPDYPAQLILINTLRSVHNDGFLVKRLNYVDSISVKAMHEHKQSRNKVIIVLITFQHILIQIVKNIVR